MYVLGIICLLWRQTSTKGYNRQKGAFFAMKLKTSKLLLILLLSLTLLTRLPLFNPSAQYFFGDEIFYKRLVITLKESEKTNNPLIYFRGVFGIHANLVTAFYIPCQSLLRKKYLVC